VIDYGTWPEQSAHYFRLDEAESTLQTTTGLASVPAAIRTGLAELTGRLMDRTFTREDGATMRIDRGLIDAGFETQTVYNFAKATQHPFLPCMGWGVGARQAAWDTRKKARGERLGHFWRIPNAAKTAGVRRVDIDTNSWKTILIPRFAFGLEPGAWRLYKRPPVLHRMIGDHMAAEYPVATAGRGRELFEWAKKPNAENHLLDAVLYAAVGANMSGARLPEETVTRHRPAPKSASTTAPQAARDAQSDRPKSLAERKAANRRRD
jgi:phage terminase large subunit GpA-like protein